MTISSNPSGEELRARVFALPSGRLVRELPAKGVTTASFDPSGKRLVTGGIDHTAAVWNAATGRRLHLFADHQGAVTDAVFGPKGRLVVTTSADGADPGLGRPDRSAARAHARAHERGGQRRLQQAEGSFA